MSFSSANSVWASTCSWFSFVWSWVVANNPIIVIAVLTVGIVLPVLYLAMTTTVRAFCQYGDVGNANITAPVTTVRYRGVIVNTLPGAPAASPPPAIAVRSHLEMMEEVSEWEEQESLPLMMPGNSLLSLFRDK